VGAPDMNLRGFLMRHPRPASVRANLLDGTSKTVAVDPKISWVQLAGYVGDLEPTTIECLDQEGHVLRGTAFEHLDDADDLEEGIEMSHHSPTTARIVTPDDPQSKQLVLFAQLLADAYRHTTDVAFDKMISLFEQVNKRYELTEKSLERMQKMVERLTESRIAAAEKVEDDFGLHEIADAFRAGQAQHAESQRPPAPGPRREPPPPGSYSNGRNHA
jgi:hypothetical protein